MPLTLNLEAQLLLTSLEKVISDWAFLSVEFLGDPAQSPPTLPLERTVLFQGDANARLVVRGSFGLGLELARVVRGLPAANLNAAEAAFTELSSLLAEEWRNSLKARGQDLRVVGIPEASNPESWPKTAASASFAAVVRGFAIETRAWITPPPL